jgi:hypothetical protein
MPGRWPVAVSAVVQVFLIDMFTHSSFYPAGQTTGLYECAYAFLCSTTLSSVNHNLPAGQKPGRVNEAFTICSCSRISLYASQSILFE